MRRRVMKSDRLESALASHEIIPGGGWIGEGVRAKFPQMPRGPIEFWPQGLRTTVNFCLVSNFPISIAWNPQRVQIS